MSFTAQERKERPVYSGVMKYFPDALLEVARLSKVGNDQHNPGQPLHWAKEKSTDEMDALMRHALEAGTLDTDGMRHSAKVAWRALANLQREIEAERKNAVTIQPSALTERRLDQMAKKYIEGEVMNADFGLKPVVKSITVDEMQGGHVTRHDNGELPTPPHHYKGDFGSPVQFVKPDDYK